MKMPDDIVGASGGNVAELEEEPEEGLPPECWAKTGALKAALKTKIRRAQRKSGARMATPPESY
jgi:hypothetical protein